MQIWLVFCFSSKFTFWAFYGEVKRRYGSIKKKKEKYLVGWHAVSWSEISRLSGNLVK